MGLAPVFILWKKKAPTLSFQLSVWFGVIVGMVLAFGKIPDYMIFTSGRYAALLWANIWGLIGCFVLFLIPTFFYHGATETN